jgi:hypothetical protein
MNLKKVFALFLGVIGFLISRVIASGDPISSPNGCYDLRPSIFIFGLTLIFMSGIFFGQENN